MIRSRWHIGCDDRLHSRLVDRTLDGRAIWQPGRSLWYTLTTLLPWLFATGCWLGTALESAAAPIVTTLNFNQTRYRVNMATNLEIPIPGQSFLFRQLGHVPLRYALFCRCIGRDLGCHWSFCDSCGAYRSDSDR